MTERRRADPQVPAALTAYSPPRRAAKPEEMAGAVLVLASDAASFVNGTAFVADGARTAR